MTTTGRTRAKLLVDQTLATMVSYQGQSIQIQIPKGNRRILEILFIDEQLLYHDKPIISSISMASGKVSSMLNQVKS